MRSSVAAGWYRDPGRAHEYRYWDGDVWTANVSDHAIVSVDGSGVEASEPPGRGDDLARLALALLVIGGAAALAVSLLWGAWMKISPTLAPEDRVWGWGAVLRGLPPAILAWSVPLVAMGLAARACRQGSTALGRVVIWLCGLVVFLVSISVIGDVPETVTGESRPELKWLLLPISVAVAAASTYAGLASTKTPRSSRRGSVAHPEPARTTPDRSS